MQITRVEPFILHVPVTGSQIADSTHSITHWGVVGARIDTDAGLSGYGFTGTHAHLPGDQLQVGKCIPENRALASEVILPFPLELELHSSPRIRLRNEMRRIVHASQVEGRNLRL